MPLWTVEFDADLSVNVEAENREEALRKAREIVTEMEGGGFDGEERIECTVGKTRSVRNDETGQRTEERKEEKMEEARSSWNTLYQSKEGFECQITLRDEDEVNLAKRARRLVRSILKAGGAPLRRRGYLPEFNHARTEDVQEEDEGEETRNERRPKTYIDKVRLTGRASKEGKLCPLGQAN